MLIPVLEFFICVSFTPSISPYDSSITNRSERKYSQLPLINCLHVWTATRNGTANYSKKLCSMDTYKFYFREISNWHTPAIDLWLTHNLCLLLHSPFDRRLSFIDFNAKIAGSIIPHIISHHHHFKQNTCVEKIWTNDTSVCSNDSFSSN